MCAPQDDAGWLGDLLPPADGTAAWPFASPAPGAPGRASPFARPRLQRMGSLPVADGAAGGARPPVFALARLTYGRHQRVESQPVRVSPGGRATFLESFVFTTKRCAAAAPGLHVPLWVARPGNAR